LKANEDLLLVAPFQPTPLLGMLAQQGFAHRATAAASGDWEVLFSRNLQGPSDVEKDTVPAKSAAEQKPSSCTGVPVLEVDARGLEPPQPMVKILEALGTLPQGAKLRARTDRRPMHLYAQLEERGFVGQTEEQADGSFVTYVSRA
jgi:uncharacterized protein (DUF2249 family)